MTNWPHVEERIRPILDAMVTEAGFTPRGHLRQSWIAGAREYVENVGADPDVARRAIRYMRKRDLVIKSPRSLIAVALTLKHKGNTDADRQRYADALDKYGVDND